MPRLSPLSLVLALALAACAPTSNSSSTTAPEATGSTVGPDAPETTLAGGDNGAATTVPVPDSTETTSGRPVAPDFTLELGDGGAYTLSDGDKPVYLVFWAEW